MTAKNDLKKSLQTVLDLLIEARIEAYLEWSKTDPASVNERRLKNKHIEAANAVDAIHQLAWNQGFTTHKGKLVERDN